MVTKGSCSRSPSSGNKLLLETRKALSPEEIEDTFFVDVKRKKDVDSLNDKIKVFFDGQQFSYKFKQVMPFFIRKVPEGVPTEDLEHAYSGILTDLQDRKASGQVWLLMNNESQEDIAYHNDSKVRMKVDDDVKVLFRSIEKPREFVDVERELQKAGMKPATNTVKRKAAAAVQGVEREWGNTASGE